MDNVLKNEVKKCFNDVCFNLVHIKEFIKGTDKKSVGDYTIKSYNYKLVDDWFRNVEIGTNTTGFKFDGDTFFYKQSYMWVKGIKSYVYIGTDKLIMPKNEKQIYDDINEIIDSFNDNGSLC